MTIDKLNLPSKENAVQTKINELVDAINAVVVMTITDYTQEVNNE